MQTKIKLLSMALFSLLVISCSDKKDPIAVKKAQLEKLKDQQSKLITDIAKLEKEILKEDPNAIPAKPKLVKLVSLEKGKFDHSIDLQGMVDAMNVVYVSPRGAGGQVKAVLVKNGDRVQKGQLLLRLDDAIARQSLAAAEQQITGLKAQLDQAQSIYDRQQNLWKQNIGTEVQVLNAKTNAEALKSQLAAAEANIKLAREQVGMANVYAEISGVVDRVNVKVGEFFSPQTAAMAATGIRIVNSSNLKVTVQVPENYLEKINVGTGMKVILPEANNKEINTKVSVASKVIDNLSRSFTIEGKLPNDKDLRPNQNAIVRLQDYSANNALTIPLNTLQSDDKGKFVIVAVKEGNKLVAKKREVTVGQIYGETVEVMSGLEVGDQLVTEGYQSLYEGQALTTS
ncbi:MAG TPA: efflux RND transporter periplasmic adaptor subunit [Flavihumibacter sp.]|nr:efflux RND transporter periplasmic adaptor subunit [Bacteroidota bacterium]HPZ87167.1 efflux RND transporter periplasmic adaptor subunit [Flavihumibacter sp.]HQD08528.1 efflux RND transporter periplasmic adaptor subunit [Flavihumibacter sp.]